AGDWILGGRSVDAGALRGRPAALPVMLLRFAQVREQDLPDREVALAARDDGRVRREPLAHEAVVLGLARLGTQPPDVELAQVRRPYKGSGRGDLNSRPLAPQSTRGRPPHIQEAFAAPDLTRSSQASKPPPRSHPFSGRFTPFGYRTLPPPTTASPQNLSP